MARILGWLSLVCWSHYIAVWQNNQANKTNLKAIEESIKEVYEAYRKVGYSKKFLAEHEGDILLHKAAKAAFNKRKLKKLLKVKELSAEYNELLAEKRKPYPEYRRTREEMRELLTIKANVERALNMEVPEAGYKKDHSPR